MAIAGTAFAVLMMIGVIYIPPFHSHDAFQTAYLHGARQEGSRRGLIWVHHSGRALCLLARTVARADLAGSSSG